LATVIAKLKRGRNLRELINSIILKAQGLPLPEKLAPRHTKAGTLDLTAATLLVKDVEMHHRIGQCI
jgi:hypothetical protein